MKNSFISIVFIFGSVCVCASENQSFRSMSQSPKNTKAALFIAIESSEYDDAQDLLSDLSQSNKFSPQLHQEIGEAVKNQVKQISKSPQTSKSPQIVQFVQGFNRTARMNTPTAKSLRAHIENPKTSPELRANCEAKLNLIINK